MKDKNDLKATLEKIRAVRSSLGLKQEYMAEQLRISQPLYSDLESGKKDISLRRFLKIAAVLDITAAQLLEAQDAAPQENETRLNNLETEMNLLKSMLHQLMSKREQ